MQYKKLTLVIVLSSLLMVSCVQAGWLGTSEKEKAKKEEQRRLAIEAEDNLPKLDELVEVRLNEETKMKEVVVQHENLRVEVPFVENECSGFNEARLNFDRTTNSAAKVFVNDLARKVFVDNISILVHAFSISKDALGFLSKTRQNYLDYANKNNARRLGKDFNQSLGKMIQDLAAAEEKDKTKRLVGEVAYMRTSKLFDALEKVVNNSPCGMFLDWPKMTINGERAIQWAAPIIQYFRDTHRGALLSVIQAVGGRMKDFSS